MSCIKRAKLRCENGRQFAVCIKYEGEIPDWSELVNEGCVVVEEAVEELYTQVTTNSEALDVSGVSSCLDIGYGNPKTLTNILQTHATFMCEIAQTFSDANFDITSLNLDTDCLVDRCGGTVSTPASLPQLLQILIDQVCANTVQIQANQDQIALNTVAIQNLTNQVTQNTNGITAVQSVTTDLLADVSTIESQITDIQTTLQTCCP